MAKTDAEELRIYCVCGQKMKVSRDMFGKPGKCIACRQKIRVPKPSELAPGAHVIYLKDYPEFLRRPAAPIRKDEDTQDDHDEAVLGHADDLETLIPFGTLPALQQVCSYEHKVNSLLEALREGGSEQKLKTDKSALLGYRSLARKARGELESQLRRAVVETTEGLAATKEQSAQVQLRLRAGDISYAAFMRDMIPLRRHRELLEWRLHHLRGWLQVTTPFLAGGYVDSPLTEAPVAVDTLDLPEPFLPEGELLSFLVEAFRDAIGQREHAEIDLRALRSRTGQSAMDEEQAQELEAARLQALACVAFYRSRLEQLALDAESDTRAIKAHLEVARHRLEADEIAIKEYQTIETELLQGQTANARVRELARKSLHANSYTEVPRVEATLLQRLSRPMPRQSTDRLDAWLGWFASLLLAVAAVLPLANVEPYGGQQQALSPMLPFFAIFGGMLLFTGFLPIRWLRAPLYSGIWCSGILVLAVLYQTTWHDTSPLGRALRSEAYWFLYPGILVTAFAAMVMTLAGVVSCATLPKLRWLPLGLGVVVVAGVAFSLTDGYGRYAPALHVHGPESAWDEERGAYVTNLVIENQGGREIQLGNRQLATAPTPFLYLLERRMGATSWEDLSVPESVVSVSNGRIEGRGEGNVPEIVLKSGGRVAMRHVLPAGDYRLQLQNLRPHLSPLTMSFSLAETESPEDPPNETIATERPEGEWTGLGGALNEEVPQSNIADLKLEGVINAAGTEPRFVFAVHRPGREPEQLFLRLNDTIAPPWFVQELNSLNQRVTISNGERVMILRSGEWLKIELQDESPGTEGENTLPVTP